MRQHLLTNFLVAFEAIQANKLRSLLTALGIIFGVAAVITMLAIGKGAEQEIMEQIRMVGVNNIVITPVTEQKEEILTGGEESNAQEQQGKFSPGLTLHDVRGIAEVVPGVDRLSPEIIQETAFVRKGIRRTGKLVGVQPEYFRVAGFELGHGRMFTASQQTGGDQVCIIGHDVRVRFFSQEEPLGKYIKVGQNWLKVVGVLQERIISENAIRNLGLRNYNMDIYTPFQTMLIRYVNRSLVTKAILQAGNEDDDDKQEAQVEDRSTHQIDRLVVQMKSTETLQAGAEVIARMLERRHNGKIDFEVAVPELMLKQKKRNEEVFNLVLGAIAGISLLVGGIGIMNIMLASVLERVKEIGLRKSLGATRQDIIQQFLYESVLISFTGGFTGVIIGVGGSIFLSGMLDIPTVISAFSILLAFGVSTLTGLCFGIMPARKAAGQDPISSLRYE